MAAVIGSPPPSPRGSSSSFLKRGVAFLTLQKRSSPATGPRDFKGDLNTSVVALRRPSTALGSFNRRVPRRRHPSARHRILTRGGAMDAGRGHRQAYVHAFIEIARRLPKLNISVIRRAHCLTTTTCAEAVRRRPSGGLDKDAPPTSARHPRLRIEPGRRPCGLRSSLSHLSLYEGGPWVNRAAGAGRGRGLVVVGVERRSFLYRALGVREQVRLERLR